MDTYWSIINMMGKQKEFQELEAVSALDWESYQIGAGRVEEAVYWSNVFSPNFVDDGGLILRQRQPLEHSSNDTATYDSEYLSDEAKTSAEFLSNHVHVRDLFYNDPNKNNYDNKVCVYIGHRIADGWRQQLFRLFPYHKFDVGVRESYGDIQVFAVTLRNE